MVFNLHYMNIFQWLWSVLVNHPQLNLLYFFYNFTHDTGWAIVLVAVVINVSRAAIIASQRFCWRAAILASGTAFCCANADPAAKTRPALRHKAAIMRRKPLEIATSAEGGCSHIGVRESDQLSLASRWRGPLVLNFSIAKTELFPNQYWCQAHVQTPEIHPWRPGYRPPLLP